MTKKELVTRIAEVTGQNQADVQVVVQKVLDYIIDSLAADQTVEFRNFGVFEVRTTKPRIGRNPKRPDEVVTIPERRVVKFKAGKVMKARVLDAAATPAPAAGEPAQPSVPPVEAPPVTPPAVPDTSPQASDASATPDEPPPPLQFPRNPESTDG